MREICHSRTRPELFLKTVIHAVRIGILEYFFGVKHSVSVRITGRGFRFARGVIRISAFSVFFAVRETVSV